MAADNEKLAATKAASVAVTERNKDASTFKQKNLVQVHSTETSNAKKQSTDIPMAVVGLGKRMPTVTKVSDGIKVSDKDGYYRIAKDYGEVNQLVDLLRSKGNSVMYMNGFESAKWKSPEAV